MNKHEQARIKLNHGMEFGLTYKDLEYILNVLVEAEATEKALTPPTADEVCKALSEYYSKKELSSVKVLYYTDFKDKMDSEHIFYYKRKYIDLNGREQEPKIYIGNILKGRMGFHSANLPIRLITLIGRFYEGLQ
jgi:hypothetical protein